MKKEDIYSDTRSIAKGLEMQHAKVVQSFETLIPKLDDYKTDGLSLNPLFAAEQRTYRGKEFTAYVFNRDCTFLLVMRFDTKLARQWQGRIIAGFNAMERKIAEAIAGQSEETDVIKQFVEYATEQGSKSAQFYYKHITNATYKALGMMSQRKPKLRDMMNIYELSELLLAERLAKNSLKRYMELGRGYKDIYESVKDDLLRFCEGLHMGRVEYDKDKPLKENKK